MFESDEMLNTARIIFITQKGGKYRLPYPEPVVFQWQSSVPGT